jgi:hypothetical protein
VRVLLAARRTASACRRRCRGTGVPTPRRRAPRSSPAARSASCTRRTHRRRAARRRRPRRSGGVGGEPGVGADVLERLLRRAQVADAVVEHGDQRAGGRSQHTLGARHRTSPRRAPRRAGSAPRPLNVASMMWCTLRAAHQRTCSVMPAPWRTTTRVLGELRVERRVAERQALGHLDLPHDERATRQVERDVDQRLVERVRPLAKRRTPTLSPSASRNASPSAMPTSSTVWWVSMCRSPVASMRRSNPPCLPSCSSMWS